jgi:hypothetical protein
MTASIDTFDSKLDPFSATYKALTTGQPSWSGGFKCITINGQSALEYLETNQMSWKEYYDFMRGTGAFAASRVAGVLQDDTMMAGIRRRFFSKSAKAPENKHDIKNAIERNVQIVLRKASLQAMAGDIVLHMVGEPPLARSKSTQQAFQNLFQTNAALKDITRIVDVAAEVADLEEAKKLIEEVFSYALPDERAPSNVDEQIARGISVLLEKRCSVEQIFALFQKGYPTETSEPEMLKRFIPLFLKGLSMVEYPVEPMKSLLDFLCLKAVSSDALHRYIEQARVFFLAIEQNKKKQEDTCFLAVPLLLSVLGNWPNGDFEAEIQKIMANKDQYFRADQRAASGGKESLPGLTGFAALLQSEMDINQIYSVRPQTYRTGDERKDFSLFFHHVLESAKHSLEPGRVLNKVLPLLSEHLKEQGNESFVEDLKIFLQVLADDSIAKDVISVLESLVPKDRKPTIMPKEAQRRVIDMLFRFVVASHQPLITLSLCFPIFEKQLAGAENTALVEDLKGLLKLLMDRQSDGTEIGIISTVLVSLLDRVIPKYGRAAELDAAGARVIVADMIYLLHVGKVVDVDFESIASAVVRSLSQVKGLAIASVREHALGGGGSSQEFACKAAFLWQIGRLLAFKGDEVNIGFLPRIYDVFFGSGGALGEPSAPLLPEYQKILEDMLMALSRTHDTEYNETLREAGVPEKIRAWVHQ